MTSKVNKPFLLFFTLLFFASDLLAGGSPPPPPTEPPSPIKLSISEQTSLNFSAPNGQVISPDTFDAASFLITGRADSTVEIFVSESVILRSTESGISAQVYDFTRNTMQVQLDASGEAWLRLGATIEAIAAGGDQHFHGKGVLGAQYLGSEGSRVETQFNISAGSVSSLICTELLPMDFGLISAGSQESTLNPNSPGAAAFEISGEPNSIVSILTLESSISLSNGSNDIELRDFQVDPYSGLLDGGGMLSASVGATIDSIAVDTPPGIYSGSFTLLNQYQLAADGIGPKSSCLATAVVEIQ